jgi:CRISPR-associated exonuclease Cas4
MHVNGTLISYYFYCKRRMWLHANDIKMEDNSEDVAMGLLVEKESYKQRSKKYEQIEIGPIKIDFYDIKNKTIHEVKKSGKFHETHIWQMKFYIYMFEQYGINEVSGILEYPKERKTEEVCLSHPDRERIKEMEMEINRINTNEKCPPVIHSHKCKNCAYNDFCYSGEIELL